jgi:hypothetical protein
MTSTSSKQDNYRSLTEKNKRASMQADRNDFVQPSDLLKKTASLKRQRGKTKHGVRSARR